MNHPVLARLASSDPEERALGCRAAVEDPSAVVLLDALAERLGDASRHVARAASNALAQLGRDHDVASALRKALHARNASQRWYAARTLARLEPPAPKLLPALVDALVSAEGDVRWEATRLLVETGRLHGEVLPLLLGLVRSAEHPFQRAMAAHALRELGPDDPRCAAALLEALRDPEPGVQRAALTALSGLLDPPEAVLRGLRDCARSAPDPASRQLAAAALERLPLQKSVASSE